MKRSNPMSTTPLCRIVFTGLALVMACTLPAQEDTVLPAENVEVVKNFDARLVDARKIEIMPEVPELDTVRIPQEYQLQTGPADLTYAPPRLRPLAMPREPQPDAYPGFVQAGYGFPRSPFVRAGYTLRTENGGYGQVRVRHHSANNNAKVENQRFGETSILFTGQAPVQEKFVVRGNVGFDQRLVSFYGYDQADTTFTKEETKQRFNRFHIGGLMRNAQQNTYGLDYTVSASFYGLRDFFQAKENGLDLSVEGVKWFADSHPLALRIALDHSAFSAPDSLDRSLTNFVIEPHFTFHGERFRVRLGANMVTLNDGLSLFPNLEGLVTLAGNAFAIYAGWQGGHQQQSFDRLTRYNPFLSSNALNRVSTYRDLYAGIKGAAGGWNYHGQVGLRQINDLALFLPEEMDTRMFMVLYDTAQNVYISGSAGIELWPGFDLNGTVQHNFYTLDNEAKAWHLPNLELSANARYRLLEDRLALRADLFMANGVPYRTETDDADRLGALLDLSVGAHYQILNRVGLWAQVNNLTNNRRERWQRYPTFGINGLAGVLIKF